MKKILFFCMFFLLFSMPTIADVNFEKAKKQFEKENFRKTRKYLKKSLNTDPGNIQARFLMADTYTAQKKFKTAIRLYRNIIENVPENNEALNRLGHVYFAGEFYRDAIEIFAEASEKEPDNEKPLYMLGMSYALCMDLDKAYTIYRKLKKKNEKLANKLLNQIQGHLT